MNVSPRKSLRCVRCGEPADYCSGCVRKWEAEDAAVIADLKARLKAIRDFLPELSREDKGSPLDRATDLRVKNWRKP